MSERVNQIRERLSQALNPTQLAVRDDSGAHAGHAGAMQSGGGHFSVEIVSEAFEGKSMVQRHQLVYKSLGNLMQTDIHALIIKALTPSEVI